MGVRRSPSSNIPRRSFLRRAGVGIVAVAPGSLSLPGLAAENKPATAEAGLFETIYSLRAIRWLKPDPIPEETLKKIVEAGIHAPSGGNRQDWGFILVRDPELIGKTTRKPVDEVLYWDRWGSKKA